MCMTKVPPMHAMLQGRGGRTRGKQVYLGSYTNEEDAARAYDLAVLAFLGVDATTNVSARCRQVL